MADELQQLLTLLLAGPYPTPLWAEHTDIQPHTRFTSAADLKTAKQVVQLLRRKIPRQFYQQVMDVFDNDLMLAILTGPYSVQILQTQHLFLDAEPDQLVQFLHILRLVQVVSQHNCQNIVLLYPVLAKHTPLKGHHQQKPSTYSQLLCLHLVIVRRSKVWMVGHCGNDLVDLSRHRGNIQREITTAVCMYVYLIECIHFPIE